jgi:phosphoenolpyruvate-protein kinase (PTS system EI component)
MGKMKEKFLEDQEKAIQDAIDAFMDDDYQLEEYYTSLKQEEVQANHDAWWNSLTEEQKQKLYEEQEAYEKDRINNDMNGPNSQYGV